MRTKNHWIGKPLSYMRVALFASCMCIGFSCLPTAFAGTSSTKSSSVVFGAVGHDDRPGATYPYNRIPVAQQIDLLDKAGLKAYRVSCNDSTCPAIIQLTAEKGMLFLRSLDRLQPDSSLDEKGNYQRGYRYAHDEALKYKNLIHYYEAGNELDNWTGIVGDGGSRIQYNPLHYPKARAFIKGLINGVHDADPSAKVAVDDAGYCHYGFLDALWADGIRWDITAFHWYSDEGNIEKAGCRNANVASIHAAFGRPVWITEFNLRSKPDKDDPQARAKWIAAFVSQVRSVAPRYNIHAAFAYELFDESGLKGGEAFYGILDNNGSSKADWKPIFHP